MAENLPEPKSRVEMFLARAAGEEAPELEPKTRIEMFLQAIAEGGGGGGGGGTTNYNQLSNKPQINSVTLSGNKTTSQLGLAGEDIIVYGDTTPASGNKLWVAATPSEEVELAEMDDLEGFVESTSVTTIWTGTQAQYDAIQTKDPDTLYLIEEPTA